MATDTLKMLKDTLAADIATIGAIKSEKDALAFITNKASVGATDATLTRQMGVLAFLMGKADRAAKKNEPASVEAAYDALQKRMRFAGSGRKEVITKSTRDTMVSYNNALARLGFVKDWDSSDALAWSLDKVKGSYVFRGKVIRQIANEATKPDDARLEEILNAAAAKPSLDKASVTIKNAVEAMAKKFPEAASNPEHKAALAALVRAARNLVTVTSDASDDDGLAELMREAA